MIPLTHKLWFHTSVSWWLKSNTLHAAYISLKQWENLHYTFCGQRQNVQWRSVSIKDWWGASVMQQGPSNKRISSSGVIGWACEERAENRRSTAVDVSDHLLERHTQLRTWTRAQVRNLSCVGLMENEWMVENGITTTLQSRRHVSYRFIRVVGYARYYLVA